ncbi:DUF5990 family protein [Nocardioides sp. NBC_00163]|uniref:DUF5990 family protein n=1 Tax=Nocardioides sp. NBC_00163 TaxID=2975999 RepID=UPI003244AE42
MLLEIRGHNLPGRTWELEDGPCHNVHVGIQRGKHPVDLVRGDSESAVWKIEIELLDVDAGLDFRGDAVQGRRGARFVYLTWGDVGGDGFTMFRRAKFDARRPRPTGGVWPDRSARHRHRRPHR